MIFIANTLKISRFLKQPGIKSNYRNFYVLGIESSCDDTGIAIVSSDGEVKANVLNSQQKFHMKYGGIIPPRAQDLHRANIERVFQQCIDESNITPDQLEAIAVTNRPGLPLSLVVGLRFAKHLGRRHNKPLIPVHHMEAHALQARMEHSIPYPFLCLLISGGHSQLAFVRSPQSFSLLGESLDDAPGEAFDKISRRLRLYMLPKYRHWNGGQTVEDVAKGATNPDAFEFPLPLAHKRNCNFSFAGIKNNSFRAIRAAERAEKTPPDGLIDEYENFCAGLLRAVSRHLMNRTQRAIEFCIARNYFQPDVARSLVVSGGVANNDFIYNEITHLAEQYECQTYRPSKKYCSDNGVMIAWNGIEHLLHTGRDSLRWDYENVGVVGKVKLGDVLMHEVEEANIKCKWVQMLSR